MPADRDLSGEQLAPVAVGDVLAGKFRVDQVLGVGGMGVVVAAYHLQLEEPVAIKFLRPEAMTIESVVARFAREARAAVKIKSEHVARVTDVGTLESGEPYMVMEHLAGVDLAAMMEEPGGAPLEAAVAVEYLLQALEAVAEAHSLGIVHRDLKPANLFVTRRADGSPSIKVLDFGISKVTGHGGISGTDAVLTGTVASMGTPVYMSPEQMVSARDVDARTDIWALGVILYELVSGAHPFPADTMPQLCTAILHANPHPFPEHLPVPAGLEAVVVRCLDKDVTRRYRHAGELARALAPFAPPSASVSVDRVCRLFPDAAEGVAAPPAHPAVGHLPGASALEPTAATQAQSSVGPGPGLGTGVPAQTSVSWEGAASGAKTRTVSLVVGVAAGLVAIVGIGATVLWTSGSERAGSEQASAGPSSSVDESETSPTTAEPTPPEPERVGNDASGADAASSEPPPDASLEPPPTTTTPTWKPQPNRPPSPRASATSTVPDYGDRK